MAKYFNMIKKTNELNELILIARAIISENSESKRIVMQCERIEELALALLHDKHCKLNIGFNDCPFFKSSVYGCTMCENFIRPA
jgi:hypothetical protein